jgi:hypothetical protein
MDAADKDYGPFMPLINRNDRDQRCCYVPPRQVSLASTLYVRARAPCGFFPTGVAAWRAQTAATTCSAGRRGPKLQAVLLRIASRITIRNSEWKWPLLCIVGITPLFLSQCLSQTHWFFFSGGHTHTRTPQLATAVFLWHSSSRRFPFHLLAEHVQRDNNPAEWNMQNKLGENLFEVWHKFMSLQSSHNF